MEPPQETSGRGLGIGSWLSVGLGVLLGSLALWLALRGLAIGDLIACLARINYPLTIAALLTTFATLLVSAFRWKLLFHPDHRRLHTLTLFRAIIVGQMLNIVVPLRVGELARIYAVAEREGLSKTRVLATLAVEKVLDLAMCAMAIAVLLTSMALPGDVPLRSRTLWIVGVGGSIALWLLARHGDTVARWLWSFVPAAAETRKTWIGRVVDRFLDGLSALRTPSAGLGAVLLSFVILVLAALTNYLLFAAFDLDLPFLSAVSLLVILQVGSVPPSLPGKLGIFNYLTVLGLGAFGVDRNVAFSYSLVLYAVAWLPKVLVGAALVATGARTATGRKG
jgi:glycosyltransferase 2 family protein